MNVDNLHIALVQYDITGKSVSENLALLEKLLSKIEKETQLIVLPETFNTGFMNNPEKLAENADGLTFQWMKKQALKLKSAICGSFMVKENGKIYNRFYFITPEGEFQFYDKRHLFRFGGETKSLTEGNKRIIVNYLGWKLFPMVCYDIRFPVFAYNKWDENSGYEYDAMLVCANWPQSRSKIWNTLLKARAIENQCYVAAVNRVGVDTNDIKYGGHSQIIDAKGNVKLKAAHGKETLLSLELHYDSLEKFRKHFCTGQDQRL